MKTQTEDCNEKIADQTHLASNKREGGDNNQYPPSARCYSPNCRWTYDQGVQ